MDFGQAFAYISEDEEWLKKVGIGAIVGAIPIVNFTIFGYQAEVARNVAAGVERPLPEWDEFGKYFLDGLSIMGAMLVYILPIIILMFCMNSSMIFVLDPANQPLSNSGQPPPELFLIFGLMLACIMPYMIFMYMIWPLFTIQVARVGSFGANFRFAEMWQLVRKQPANYALIVVLFFGLYMAVGLILLPAALLLIIPCIGFIIYMLLSGGATMLVLMVIGHLQGQFILENGSTVATTPPDADDDYATDVMG
jgi:hypothetical protein